MSLRNRGATSIESHSAKLGPLCSLALLESPRKVLAGCRGENISPGQHCVHPHAYTASFIRDQASS